MKTTRIMAVVLLIVASGLALYVARAPQPGIICLSTENSPFQRLTVFLQFSVR